MTNPLEALMGWLRARHYREMERAQARIDAALKRQAEAAAADPDRQASVAALEKIIDNTTARIAQAKLERAAAGAPVDIAATVDNAMCGCAHCILTREPGL